ncbi:MAG: hypothetical protein V1679_00240 [Candidatus Peregrinibacteria bacterium]
MRYKQTLTTETRKVVKALIITLSVMIVILSIAFIATTNLIGQKGYAFQQQKIRNGHLRSENATLSTKITDATAFSKIEDSDKLDEMQTTENKNYVTSEDNSVE